MNGREKQTSTRCELRSPDREKEVTQEVNSRGGEGTNIVGTPRGKKKWCQTVWGAREE